MPVIGNADFDAAKDDVDLHNRFLAIDVGAVEVELNAAKDGANAAKAKILRGDPPLDSSEDRRRVHGVLTVGSANPAPPGFDRTPDHHQARSDDRQRPNFGPL